VEETGSGNAGSFEPILRLRLPGGGEKVRHDVLAGFSACDALGFSISSLIKWSSSLP
jgi:hypothetical protein